MHKNRQGDSARYKVEIGQKLEQVVETEKGESRRELREGGERKVDEIGRKKWNASLDPLCILARFAHYTKDWEESPDSRAR